MNIVKEENVSLSSPPNKNQLRPGEMGTCPTQGTGQLGVFFDHIYVKCD